MNNFGNIGDKVPARSHTFHAFYLEKLSKENPIVQAVITNKYRGVTAKLFKQDCMREFSKIRREK